MPIIEIIPKLEITKCVKPVITRSKFKKGTKNEI